MTPTARPQSERGVPRDGARAHRQARPCLTERVSVARADQQGVTVSSGERNDAVRELIALGEEKGDLLREEIDALPPVDVAAREVDGLVSRCRDAGIDVDAAALEGEGPHHARMDADESQP